MNGFQTPGGRWLTESERERKFTQLDRIARTLWVCIVVMTICATVNFAFFIWGLLKLVGGLTG